MRDIYVAYFIGVVLKPMPMVFQFLRSRKFQGKILITSGVTDIFVHSSTYICFWITGVFNQILY